MAVFVGYFFPVGGGFFSTCTTSEQGQHFVIFFGTNLTGFESLIDFGRLFHKMVTLNNTEFIPYRLVFYFREL